MHIPQGPATSPNEASRPHPSRQEINVSSSQAQDNYESENAAISLAQVVEKSDGIISELNRLLKEYAEVSLQSLGAQHPVKIAVQQLFWLISQSANPDESCLVFSEKIIGTLFISDSILAREVYVLVIRRLADFSKPLANELSEWFMYSTDSQKYNIPVILAILRADIITCLELDLHLSRQLETGSIAFLSFVCQILRNLCLSVNAHYTHLDFLYVFESLRRLKSGHTQEVEALLIEINIHSAVWKLNDVVDGSYVNVRDLTANVLKEWHESFSHPASNENFQADFATKATRLH